MTKDDLKNGIADMHAKLAGLEGAARKLQNQNLADVVKSAMGKLQQLGDHPDLERVADEDVREEELPFDPSAGTRPVPGSAGDVPNQTASAPLSVIEQQPPLDAGSLASLERDTLAQG